MIDHIDLGGTVYPVSIGFSALQEVERVKGISLINVIEEIQKTASIGNTVYICWLAIKEGLRKEGKECALTEIEVADLLDEPGKLTELAGLIGVQLGKIFAPLLEQAQAQKARKR